MAEYRETLSLCPMCLRPSVLADRGGDVLGTYSGTINITRTRDDGSYCCHGCGAVFARPLKMARSAIEDARGASKRSSEGEQR